MFILLLLLFFFFKQKTAYEMRISDWSSDVCSSDLVGADAAATALAWRGDDRLDARIDRDSALVARAIGDERRRSTPLRIRHDSDHDHIVSGPVPPVRDRCAAADHSRALFRSEERRVGKECVSTCSSRW